MLRGDALYPSGRGHHAPSTLKTTHPFQFRPQSFLIECMLRELAAALDPEQKKMRGPVVGVWLHPAVAQVHSAVQYRVAGLHFDRGIRLIAEIIIARAVTADPFGADFERPRHIVAIDERQRNAVLA